MPDTDKDLSAERTAECAKVARSIHALIGEAALTVPLLNAAQTDDKAAQLLYYQKMLQDKILPIIQAADLRVADIEFLMSLVIQPVDMIKEAVGDLLVEGIKEQVMSEIARKLIAFMGNEAASLPIGDITKEQRPGLLNFVKEQINDQLKDVMGQLVDMASVMKLVDVPFTMIREMLIATRSSVVDHAVAFKFGLSDGNDIRFSHIIAAQKEQAEAKKLSTSPSGQQ